MTIALRQIALSAHGIEPVHRRRPNVPWSEALGPEDHGKGRRCTECNATLCRYNGGDSCWCHNLDDEVDMGLAMEALAEMAA